MGNVSSDEGEQIAHKFINFIPGVNLAYNAVRGPVYAAKGNAGEAGASACAMLMNVPSLVPGAQAAGVAANVIGTGAGEVLKVGLKK